MHLGTGEPPVMVKFKDYGFFVPKDASGRTVIVEGEMTLKQETVEQTRHYLEDAGKHEEAAKITEGRRLYHFVASGVAIQKPAKLDPARYEHFGAGILEGPWTEVAVALAKPEDFVGRTVRLAGPITQVCQTKGCWMHLGTGEPPVMVKFKDYGFFVPKDASGRTVIVEGEMTLKQETVAQTRHYLEDAGKHAEAAKITEGRKLYHFVATGVAIEKSRD
jgi:cell division protein YceG involved in septum cleavage